MSTPLQSALQTGWDAAAPRPRAPRLGTPAYTEFARRHGRVGIHSEVVWCVPWGHYRQWVTVLPVPEGAPVWKPLRADSLAEALQRLDEANAAWPRPARREAGS